MSGLELLGTIRGRAPELAVIVMDRFGSISSAVEGM